MYLRTCAPRDTPAHENSLISLRCLSAETLVFGYPRAKTLMSLRGCSGRLSFHLKHRFNGIFSHIRAQTNDGKMCSFPISGKCIRLRVCSGCLSLHLKHMSNGIFLHVRAQTNDGKCVLKR